MAASNEFFYTLVSILSLLLAAAYVGSAQPPYEHLLALQWPPTKCQLPTCNPAVRLAGVKKAIGFTLHGLWQNPERNPCTGMPFNIVPLNEDTHFLRHELDWTWPSYTHRSDEWFWGHEWDDHGRCIQPIPMDLVDYFRAAVTLYSNVFGSIVSELERAGIEVGNAAFSGADLIGAMNNVRNRPIIVCTRVGNNRYKLLELHYCVDAAFENVVECPYHAQQHYSCPSLPADIIYFPHFPQ